MPKPLPKPEVLIEEPSPYDTLETWESHLRTVEALPDGAFLKEDMLATAKRRIALKRKERQE